MTVFHSLLYDFAWPLMITSAHNTSAMNPSVVRHSPEPVAKGSHEPLKVLVMLPTLHQRKIRVASLIGLGNIELPDPTIKKVEDKAA